MTVNIEDFDKALRMTAYLRGFINAYELEDLEGLHDWAVDQGYEDEDDGDDADLRSWCMDRFIENLLEVQLYAPVDREDSRTHALLVVTCGGPYIAIERSFFGDFIYVSANPGHVQRIAPFRGSEFVDDVLETMGVIL